MTLVRRHLQGVLAGVMVFTVFSGVALAAEAVVTNIRVGLDNRQTRIVLDLTNPIEFRVFTLADPYRVVIDMPEVGWRMPSQPLPADKGLLAKLRYGLFKPGASRLVLDLSAPALVSGAFVVSPGEGYGHRLVLDLARTSRQSFLVTAGKAPVRVTSSSPVSNSVETLTRVPVTKPLQRSAALAPPSPKQGQLPAAQRPPKRPPKRNIVLDPGHGGVDPGTTGVSGTLEKYLTLSVAREIKKRLETTGRYKVTLTRSRDVFVRLKKRVARARAAEADLFVSIHADAIKDRNIRGLSVYTLSEKASDKEAAALAEKENKADLIAGIDLTNESTEVTNILIDLAQRESMNQSAFFASGLVKELKKEVHLLRNTHRFAGFAVLKAPDVPSILLELGFLSNRQDEKKLRSKKFRARLAKSMLRALNNYFSGVEEARRR